MQTYPHATALANRLNKTLIGFDLEHTGGKGRGITEFGATGVTPDGHVLEYVSLVKPRTECEFMPFVCRLTGIWPETVEQAPVWGAVLEQFVLPNKDAIWCGFNSRSSDMPIVRKESAVAGVDASVLLHLDLMRVSSGMKGSLTERVSMLWPDVDVSGAHRALADSRFTMLLLEGLLTQGEPLGDKIVGGQLCLTQNVQDAEASKPARSAGQPFDPSFLVKDGRERQGEPWTDSEKIWVASQFKKGKTPVELGKANGRTAYAVAYRLYSENLIDKLTRDSFRNA